MQGWKMAVAVRVEFRAVSRSAGGIDQQADDDGAPLQ
jgi:hypothetical protein